MNDSVVKFSFIFFSISFVGIALFISCSNGQQKFSDPLISYHNEFVMEDGEQASKYYTDHEDFIQKYYSERQLADTLMVTTLKEINACGKTVADIRISGDSLFLETVLVSKEACTGVAFYKFTYKIFNPTRKKYIIRSSI